MLSPLAVRPGALDIDDEDDDTEDLSVNVDALPSEGSTPEQKLSFVKDALQRAYSYREKADKATSALRDYRQPKGQTLLAIGSALLQPTRTGSLGETIGNVGQSLAVMNFQRDREMQRNKRADTEALIRRYDAMADHEEKSAKSAQQGQEMMALAQGLYPNDPIKQAAFAASPEKFLASLADNEKAYNLGQGDSRFQGGNRLAYNNKTGVDDGVAYTVGPDGNAIFGAERPLSHAEVEAARHNRASEGIAGGNLGVAQGNLTMRGKELETKLSTVATPAVLSDPLPALEAALRKRGLLK